MYRLACPIFNFIPASTRSASIESGNNTESTQKSGKGETKSTTNPYKETDSATPKPVSGDVSQTMQIIIITGSVLSAFLIIIIINQIHGKFKKYSKHSSASQMPQLQTPNEAEEVVYIEINEAGMLGNISCFDKLKLKRSIKQQNTDADPLKIEISNVEKPALPNGRNRVYGIKSEESPFGQEEMPSDYLAVVTDDKLHESQDNSS
jgi:hypothetical protein